MYSTPWSCTGQSSWGIFFIHTYKTESSLLWKDSYDLLKQNNYSMMMN